MFAFEHDGQTVKSRHCRRSLRYQSAEELFGVFLPQRLLEPAVARVRILFSKEGKRPNVLVSISPGFFAQIFTPKTFAFLKKQSIEKFPRRERSIGRLANVGAMFDRPIGRQRIIIVKVYDGAKASESSEASRLSLRRWSKTGRLIQKRWQVPKRPSMPRYGSLPRAPEKNEWESLNEKMRTMAAGDAGKNTAAGKTNPKRRGNKRDDETGPGQRNR